MIFSPSSFPDIFSVVFTNMVAAGEASGDVAPAFDRLATITSRQRELRNRVVGAMTYPALLSLLCVGVVAGVFTFVLPRFAELFENLDAELPFLTQVMITASGWWLDHWLILLPQFSAALSAMGSGSAQIGSASTTTTAGSTMTSTSGGGGSHSGTSIAMA